MGKCEFCGEPVQGNFCTACGAPAAGGGTIPRPAPWGEQARVQQSEAPYVKRPEKRRWHQIPTVIVLFSIFLFPVAFFWMWRYSGWSLIVKTSVTILALLAMLYFFLTECLGLTSGPAAALRVFYFLR